MERNQPLPQWVHLPRYERLHLPEAIKKRQEEQIKGRFLRVGEADERVNRVLADLSRSGYITRDILAGLFEKDIFPTFEDFRERLWRYYLRKVPFWDAVQGVVFERFSELRLLERLLVEPPDQGELFRKRMQGLRDAFSFDFSAAQEYVTNCGAPVMLKCALCLLLHRGQTLNEAVLHCSILGSNVAVMVLARPYLELSLGFVEWGLRFDEIKTLKDLTRRALQNRRNIFKLMSQDLESGHILVEQIKQFYGYLSKYTHNNLLTGGRPHASYTNPETGYVVGTLGGQWSDTQVYDLITGLQVCHNLLDIGMLHIKEGIENRRYPATWNCTGDGETPAV